MERRDDIYLNDAFDSNVIQKGHRQYASKHEAVVKDARKRDVHILNVMRRYLV